MDFFKGIRPDYYGVNSNTISQFNNLFKEVLVAYQSNDK